MIYTPDSERDLPPLPQEELEENGAHEPTVLTQDRPEKYRHDSLESQETRIHPDSPSRPKFSFSGFRMPSFSSPSSEEDDVEDSKFNSLTRLKSRRTKNRRSLQALLVQPFIHTQQRDSKPDLPAPPLSAQDPGSQVFFIEKLEDAFRGHRSSSSISSTNTKPDVPLNGKSNNRDSIITITPSKPTAPAPSVVSPHHSARASPPPSFLIDDDPFACLSAAPNATSIRLFPAPVASSSSGIKRPPPISRLEIPPPTTVQPIPRSPLNEMAVQPIARVRSTSPLSTRKIKEKKEKAAEGDRDNKPPGMRQRARSFFSAKSAPVSPTKSSFFAPSPALPPSTRMRTSTMISTLDEATSMPPPMPAAMPLPPMGRATSSSRVHPAHQRPAFSSRPSLPSLNTLARMNVVLPNTKRKGHVGAGLPYEPWSQTSSEDEDRDVPPRISVSPLTSSPTPPNISPTPTYSHTHEDIPPVPPVPLEFATRHSPSSTVHPSTPQPLLPSQILSLGSLATAGGDELDMLLAGLPARAKPLPSLSKQDSVSRSEVGYPPIQQSVLYKQGPSSPGSSSSAGEHLPGMTKDTPATLAVPPLAPPTLSDVRLSGLGDFSIDLGRPNVTPEPCSEGEVAKLGIEDRFGFEEFLETYRFSDDEYRRRHRRHWRDDDSERSHDGDRSRSISRSRSSVDTDASSRDDGRHSHRYSDYPPVPPLSYAHSDSTTSLSLSLSQSEASFDNSLFARTTSSYSLGSDSGLSSPQSDAAVESNELRQQSFLEWDEDELNTDHGLGARANSWTIGRANGHSIAGLSFVASDSGAPQEARPTIPPLDRPQALLSLESSDSSVPLASVVSAIPALEPVDDDEGLDEEFDEGQWEFLSRRASQIIVEGTTPGLPLSVSEDIDQLVMELGQRQALDRRLLPDEDLLPSMESVPTTTGSEVDPSRPFTL